MPRPWHPAVEALPMKNQTPTWLLTALKIGLSLSAFAALVARLIWPDLRLDAVSIGLLIVILVPWMSGLFETLEFPGGWKIKFRELERVASAFGGQSDGTQQGSDPTFMAVRNLDPGLALVGLRIEIEIRLQRLAETSDIDNNRRLSAGQLVRELQRVGVLPARQASALDEVLSIANAAAHGAELPSGNEDFAFDEGPRILAWLDSRIETGGHNSDPVS